MSSPANVKDANATPPPLGFMAGSTNSLTSSPAGEHRSIYGEELRNAGEGTLSAPPPPGFNSGGPEERVRIANHALVWNNTTDASEHLSNFETRTTSFTNLAAMIGTGLAESMEDSTRAERNGALRLGGDLSSYARQTRHSASRLLGASGTSPTLLNLGLSRPTGALGSNAGNWMTNKRLSEPSMLSHQEEALRGNGSSGLLGEPPLYATENDPLSDFRASVSHRSHAQPPLGIFGNERLHQASTEIGVTVLEPDVGRTSAPPMQSEQQIVTPVISRNGTPVISRQGTPDIGDLQRGLQGMDIGSTTLSVQSEHSVSEAELEPFMWDVYHSVPSRSVVILRATTLPLQDIRSTCEAFGVLEMFRADFAERGIIFVGYYDIRSAQYAALELRQNLRRLAPDSPDLNVMYSVPMNSSSSHDESTIVMSDVPYNVSEQALMGMLSSYGAVRSLQLQPGSHYHGKTYVAEFHNIQDAKLALLELESSQPLGPEVLMEVGTRRAVDRKRGREFLSVISRWRHSNNRQATHQHTSHSNHPGMQGFGTAPGVNLRQSSTSHRSDRSVSPSTHEPYMTFRSESDGNSSSNMSQQTTQLVLGPDGRYSYVSVNPAAFPPQSRHGAPPHHQQHHHHQHHHVIDPHSTMRIHSSQVNQQRQQVVLGPHGSYVTSVSTNQNQQAYWNHAPQQHQHHQQQHQHQQQQHQQHYRSVGAPSVVSNNVAYNGADGTAYSQSTTTGGGGSGGGGGAVPYYAHVISGQADSSVSSGSQSNNVVVVQTRRPAQTEEKQDNRHLMLEIDSVETGRDTRTSLMVRNIPNKYTQQMLLSEFTDNGHGPGKIDFFYLPIDFKNKCNRGYAFINFVDYRDIVPFHRQYFGQHWRVFNSDKICDITYARIQGKAGMLKRFENSALMEKDEEYKPLVFVSNGSDKGKRLPFPSEHS